MTGHEISEAQIDAAVKAMDRFSNVSSLQHLADPVKLEPMELWRDGFIVGWAARDTRDKEPLRPGTIILLRPKTDDGAATAAVRYQAGWVRADPTSRSDYYWPFSQLIAGFDSWEIVWEPAS